MIPYHDENDTVRPAVVTLAIIAICTVMWLFVQGAGAAYSLAASVCNLGLIPGELTQTLQAGFQFPIGEGLACVVDPGPQYLNVLTSMFLHGGWMHLIGNMWFLWLFGNNVEDSMTRPRFLLFYLLCGLGAAMAQVIADPQSFIPMVGASGAISGVMGAYLVLYPRVRVYTFVPLGFFMTTMAVPAWAMLLYWAFLQIIGGVSSASTTGGGVAFWAHVGGFFAGIVLIKLFAKPNHIVAHAAHHFQPRRVGWDYRDS
jgi:membrane associated rhomboid family serine protease